jgi:hypothetical protein
MRSCAGSDEKRGERMVPFRRNFDSDHPRSRSRHHEVESYTYESSAGHARAHPVSARAGGRVDENTVSFFESGRTVPREDTLTKIQAALERRGISFRHGGCPGVTYDPDKVIAPN